MLLGISAVAGGLILVAMAMRPFLKTAPHWLRAGIWLLPFGRLLIPYSAFSVELPGGLRIFWLCGVGACLLYGAVTTLYLYLKTAGAVEYEDRIFVHDSIPFPFALGRRCYMPFEEDHIRRTWLVYQLRRGSSAAALAVRCVVFLALAIHWFNPLAWLAVIFSRRDWDSACDDMALQEKGILPCGAEEVPMWLRFCPLAAFQRGGADRRRGCELRMTGENQKRGVSAVLAGAVALATALTLIPPIPEGEATREKPLNLTGTYSMEGYGYRNPLAVGLMERDGISYEFSEELLVLRDVTSGDSVNVIPLKNVRWTALPFTKAQWGRLLWWVDPEELPYLDADYADLGNGLCFLRTELGLYLLRGKIQGTVEDTVIYIVPLTAEMPDSMPQIQLPEGVFVTRKCVGYSETTPTQPNDDAGVIIWTKSSEIKIVDRRTGTMIHKLLPQCDWKKLTIALPMDAMGWAEGMLGGQQALLDACYYQLTENRYLILSDGNLYFGYGDVERTLNPKDCGNIYLLGDATEIYLPQTGKNHQIGVAGYILDHRQPVLGERLDQALPNGIDVMEESIQVWNSYGEITSQPYDPEDGQWIYFPEVEAGVGIGQAPAVCLSDAYVRKLTENEFLLEHNRKIYYGMGIWDEETGWIQIMVMYQLNQLYTFPSE